MSKRIFTTAGVIQRENFTSSSGPGELDRRLLLQLADRRQPVRAVAVALVGVHGAAREHPHPAHEAGLRRALDEQQLERLPTAAQEDHARRLPRARRRSGVQLLARPGTLGCAHRLTLPVGNLGRMTKTTPEYAGMSTTETLQRWICESCGFIYDPEDGDPDGGIPPGTPFEEIPDTWFCPVCGARKRDFTLYED